MNTYSIQQYKVLYLLNNRLGFDPPKHELKWSQTTKGISKLLLVPLLPAASIPRQLRPFLILLPDR